MKFIIAFILTALLSYAAAFYFPWWSIAVAAFVVAALVPQKPFKAFLSAFIAVFLLWAILAFIIDANNNHILSERISQLLMKVKSSLLLIAVTGFVGGITAGFAALSGSYLRKSK